MNDQEKTKEQLIAELAELRQQVAGLEKASREKETEAAILLHTMPLEIHECDIISDITEQKRVEAALQASEERFRKVFEEGPLGVALLDLDVRIQHCNRRFCEMLGYSEDEIVALGPAGITHPDDLERNRQFSLRLAHGEIPHYTMEKRYVRKDGTAFWGQMTVSMMHDAKGRPTALIGMIEDVTDRKRVEEALQKSERMFRKLMDASPESILLVDAEGTVLIANETTAHRLGKTVDEILGRKIHDFMPADLAAQRKKHVAEAIRTGKLIRFEDKRSERYFENIIHPVMDEEGKVAAVAILGIDRTDRKRAEEALKKAHDELEEKIKERTAELASANKRLQCEIEERKRIEIALRQSEEMYKTLIETSPDGVLMTDFERNILFASQRSIELFGYDSVEDLCKQNATALVIEEERQRLTANISLLLRQRIRQQTEYIGVRRDGARFVGEVSSALLRDDRGEPRAFMALIRDVTVRKQADEALRQQHRTLKHLLQSSDHERQLIAYEIHDELAQQLTGAIMQFQTYAHQKDRKPKEAAKAFDAGMTMLQQGHGEARRLISGVRPLILDEEGIVPAITHLVNEERRRNGPQIEFRSNVQFDRLVPILENAIYRIVQEGLTNACRHSKSKKVTVGLLHRDDRVRIEIRDWGIGFDAESVQKNHFGLVGIRQRVRLLEGKCSIRSKVDKGTRIAVELPVVVRE